ncbi:hypothetical protein GCM10028856_17560 [Halopiger thermotolerans]
MSRGCGYCDQPGHDINHCPERLEEYRGLPVDNFNPDAGDGVECWVQDINETWHASMYYEDGRHAAACGKILEVPVANLKSDARFVDATHTCDACEAYLEDDGDEVPDGGFEPASELRADGGRPQIRFDDRHVDPIMDGEKTVTIRYDFEHEFEQGDLVDLVNQNGHKLTTAKIVTQCELRADWIAFADFEGHRRYTTTGELLEELSEYYSDANLHPKIVLDVIVFETDLIMADGGLEEVFRRETIVATDDGIAVGEDAAPDGVVPDE